jgi:hypothetical protein
LEVRYLPSSVIRCDDENWHSRPEAEVQMKKPHRPKANSALSLKNLRGIGDLCEHRGPTRAKSDDLRGPDLKLLQRRHSWGMLRWSACGLQLPSSS